ncbi:hypothetical protein SDC9_111761 [bioreactor metagenome]|uniref:Uncharacterized protein n=1 Tax=bioreactor metagenome TaxID=1076179 RepID=A0A645BHC7_9ZZZZ
MQVFFTFGFLKEPFCYSWNDEENDNGEEGQRYQQFQKEDNI